MHETDRSIDGPWQALGTQPDGLHQGTAGLRQELEGLRQVFDTSIDEMSALLAAGARAESANAASLARLSFARGLQGWPPGTVYTGLVELASCAGWPADLDLVLSRVSEGHCGYQALRRLLLAELAALVPAAKSLLSKFEPVSPASDAAWWETEQRRVHEVAAATMLQVAAAVDRQRLLPFLSMLADYCAAAAEAAADPAGGGARLRRFLLEQREDTCAPVVSLVAALAAGKLRTSLVMCGRPLLAVEDGAASVETMETNRPGRKGALAALPGCWIVRGRS
ncbi:hypothetical protein ABPG75_012374 [Micractinium tetrahymenae]